MLKFSQGGRFLFYKTQSVNNLPKYLLFLMLKTPIDFFNATITGTTVAHLGDRHLKTINIVIPELKILELAKSVFDPMLDLEICLQKKNSILRQTRDLLLPKLVSGELDVSEMEVAS